MVPVFGPTLSLSIFYSNETGLEVMERLSFLASLPLAGTTQTKGGGIRVANRARFGKGFNKKKFWVRNENFVGKSVTIR